MTLDKFSNGLLTDAIETFHNKAPNRRDESERLIRAAGEWHDHDQEEEHCTDKCAAWKPGYFCYGCGDQHAAGDKPIPIEDMEVA